MSMLDCASHASAWRGYEYWLEKKVLSVEALSQTQFRGAVSGSGGAVYDVWIEAEHPRRCTCTCPLAAGKRIVCKHKIALFFTAFPEEGEAYYREVVECERRAEAAQQVMENALGKCVAGMSEEQAKNALIFLLESGPDWQREQFLRCYSSSWDRYEESDEDDIFGDEDDDGFDEYWEDD